MPGPGPETAIQQFCRVEHQRVFEIAHRMIRDSTGIDADRAEDLARTIASAHSDALYRRLGEKPGGGGRARASRRDLGVHWAARPRTLEMHRGTTGARMGV